MSRKEDRRVSHTIVIVMLMVGALPSTVARKCSVYHAVSWKSAKELS